MPIQRLITFAKGLWSYQPGAPEDSLVEADNVQLDEIGKLEVRPGLDWLVGNAPTYTSLMRSANSTMVTTLKRIRNTLYIMTSTALYRASPSLNIKQVTKTAPYGSFTGLDYEATAGTSFSSYIAGPLNSLGARENACPNGSASAAQAMKVFETEKGDIYSWSTGSPVKRGFFYDQHDATPGDFRATTIGLPKLYADPNPVYLGGGGYNYIYYFHYFFKYVVNGKSFVDYGPVTQVSVLDVDNPIGGGGSVLFNNLQYPEKYNQAWASYDANSASGNFSVGIAIYRTKHNGSVPYFKDTILFGTNHTDTRTDAVLPRTTVHPLPSVLYTFGGVEEDAPVQHLDEDYTQNRGPQLFTLANNCAWYAKFYEDGNLNLYDLLQSKPLKYGAVPGSFRISLKEELVGLNYIDIYPIVFTKQHKVYRIEGIIDETGAGTHTARLIDDTIGVIHDNCIVKVQNRLFFISDTGTVAWTDGYKVVDICGQYDGLEYLFRFIDAGAIKGAYDRVRNVVQWLCTLPGATIPAPTALYIVEVNLNYQDFPVTLRYVPMESLSANNVPFSAIDCEDGFTLLGTSHGYLMKLSNNVVDDIAYDSATAGSTWKTRAVRYNVLTSPISMGNIFVTKWVTKIYVFFKNFYDLYRDISAAVTTTTDENTTDEKSLKVIDETGTNKALHIVKRWIPRTSLRSRFRQLRFSKPYLELYNSTNYANATVSGTTAVLASGTWPTGIENYFLKVGATSRRIVSVSGNTITLSGSQTAGVSAWTIHGYRKGEKVKFEGIEVEFNHIGESIEPYRNNP